jgi:hypothetical protein
MIQRIPIGATWRRWRSGTILLVIALALSGLNIVLPATAQNALALTSDTGAPVPVHRWWHDGDRDWVTIPVDASQPSNETMVAWGYTNVSPVQYYVDVIDNAAPDLVAVHRWWHDGDRDWVDIRAGSISDATMIAWGYTNKHFQYFAYTTPASGRAAINRWWHDGDRDWVTIRQDEVPDATMTAWGYTNKQLLVYAYTTQS